MKRISKNIVLGAASAAALLASSIAYAAICAVPSEVIQRTKILETNVTAQIVKSEGLLITEELRQREMLLGALKVITRQESGSGQQTSTVISKSREAAANANTMQRHAWNIADAKDRYSATGYDSCTLMTKSQSFYTANKGEAAKMASIAAGTSFKPGQWGSPTPWAAAVASGGNTDAESLFTGDDSAARKYINMIAGPQTEKPNIAPAALQAATLSKNNDDAKRSLAVEIMASIAAENSNSGSRKKLQEMVSHWTGDDGGEKWAQAMADKPLRAILLDSVRMEAANIALLAYQVKETSRTELALAGYALGRINEIIKQSDKPADFVGPELINQRQAVLGAE